MSITSLSWCELDHAVCIYKVEAVVHEGPHAVDSTFCVLVKAPGPGQQQGFRGTVPFVSQTRTPSLKSRRQMVEHVNQVAVMVWVT